MIDVYRDEIPAEKNFFRYALFVSFFPQLVAGPIERSKNLLMQLKNPVKFNVKNAEWGLLTMAYGLFLKLVVADNIAVIVDEMFENTAEYSTMALLTAVILFAFQIYGDFQGYTQLAIGSALVFGICINENFNAPYLARSVKDFWRRWHISLTSWFTDYLYIPLGGNRKGKIRKQVNTLIVFLCSGLWHGAGWHFVAWGALNGIFSVLEDILIPFYHKMINALKIKENTITWRGFRVAVTFCLVDFTWLFFRAASLGDAITLLKRFVLEFRPQWFLSESLPAAFGGDANFMIIMVSLLILFAIDFLLYKGIDFRTIIFRQQIVFRWALYLLIFLVIISWGAYGAYEQKQFIYFQF
ncbi:MAG: MBOAT family protein [Muribaculaceae bacterium]|nr:MBOAT family protein [Muribaculaceae bacterium]